MTDRELLEKAAKAAGIVIDELSGRVVRREADGQPVYWNPLTDDGDALRLAVKLGITMYPAEGEHDGATATWAHPDSEWIVVERTDNPGDDMRRAIVRAAAAMADSVSNDHAATRANAG